MFAAELRCVAVACIVGVAAACGCIDTGPKEDLVTVGKIPTLEETPPDSAAGILLRCEQAYANLTSYRGTISSMGGASYDGFRSEDKLELEIFFQAPSKIRIETELDGEKIVIVSDGKRHWEVSPFAENAPIEEHPRLEDILTANQGILRGTTVRLPAILAGVPLHRENLGLPRGKLLPALATKAELSGEEKIDNVECYRVVCERSIATWTLWIDKKEMLIRRFDLDCSEAQVNVQRSHGGGGFSGKIREMHDRDVYSVDATNVDVDDKLFRVPEE